MQRQVIAEVSAGFEGLLYIAPERFASEAFRSILPGLDVKLLAIDEAHCISMWGMISVPITPTSARCAP